jgi:hypothetical protein
MWYVTHLDSHVCLALSSDGVHWEKPDLDVVLMPDGTRTNIVIPPPLDGLPQPQPVSSYVGRWAAGARYACATYVHFGKPEGRDGIYAFWSADGVRWEKHEPAVLPRQGDRMSCYFDPVREIYVLTTRHHNLGHEIRNGVRGFKRDIGLWESVDLLHWDYHGIVLQADDLDAEDTELYGMYPFRYGCGFVGLLEVYHRAYEKLDTQLAWSEDGYHWQRVGRREACLTLGGEGAWDSHWVVPALNPPELQGDRLRFWYNGASTKHGSGSAHIRSIGLTSLRLDGFIAMEAGRKEGSLVTTDLPAQTAKRLEVNVRYPNGRFSVEVLDREGRPLEGYGVNECHIEGKDGVRLKVQWGERITVPASSEGYLKLRFNLYQGALFAYRWADATP